MRRATALVPLIGAALLAGCGASTDVGPTCAELRDPVTRTRLVFDIDRVVTPPGSPDDDPRDTPPSSRRKLRRVTDREIRRRCAGADGGYRPRAAVLRWWDTD